MVTIDFKLTDIKLESSGAYLLKLETRKFVTDQEQFDKGYFMFFYPVGVLSPTLVETKILFQSFCQERFEWDAPLPESARKQWNRWLQD